MADFKFLRTSEVETAVLDGVTAGTVASGKAVVVGDTKNIDYILIASAAIGTGNLKLGTGKVTANFDDINTLDGISTGVVVANKVVVVGANKDVDYLLITSAAIGTGGLTLGTGKVTANFDEINVLDGVTAGVVTSGKAVVVGNTKNIDYILIASAAIGTGGLVLGTGAITANFDEINVLDGVVAGTVASDKAVVLTTGKNIDYLSITSAAIGTGGLVLGTGAITALYEEINVLAGVTPGTTTAEKALVVGSGSDLSVLKILNLILVTGTPVNSVAATATFQFVAGGEAIEGETLIIDTETYELDFVGDGVTTGNIAVGTAGTGTATTAVVTYLVSAITNSSTLVTAWTGATGRELAIAWLASGATGNGKVVSAVTTGTWVASAMAGGVDGTVVAGRGIWYVDSSYIYYAIAANTIIDQNWRRVALGSTY